MDGVGGLTFKWKSLRRGTLKVLKTERRHFSSMLYMQSSRAGRILARLKGRAAGSRGKGDGGWAEVDKGWPTLVCSHEENTA